MRTFPSFQRKEKRYIPLLEYLESFSAMQRDNQWKLPLKIGDRFQLKLIEMIAHLSLLGDRLYIEYNGVVSPAHAALLAYLKQNNLFDNIIERDLHLRGYYSFYIEKQIPFAAGKFYHLYGQGIATDRETALSKAIGELVERLISGIMDTNTDILIASPKSLREKKHPIVYPPDYHHFLDIQYKRYKSLHRDPSRELSWVKGKNLVTGDTTLIPRQLTLWFEEGRLRKEVLCHATSNGSAGYFTKEGALLRGLLEVVERDGFLTHWLTMTPPEIIAIETLPQDLASVTKEFERLGFTIYILNITALAIPSAIAVAINADGVTPQVVVCGGAGITIYDAIISALQELGHGIEGCYTDNNTAHKHKNVEPFVSQINKEDRVSFWRGKERLKEFAWFLSGKRVSFQSVSKSDLCGTNDKERLTACITTLKQFGEAYYPIAYFPTHPILHDLDYIVAQVFIPKAFPFYLFEGYGTFLSDRLNEFATTKGNISWSLNPFPHMFS